MAFSIFERLKHLVADKAQDNKDFWVDDSKCKACYECDTPFSLFKAAAAESAAKAKALQQTARPQASKDVNPHSGLATAAGAVGSGTAARISGPIASGVLPSSSAFAQPSRGLPPRPNKRAEAKSKTAAKPRRQPSASRSRRVRRDDALTWDVPPALDMHMEEGGDAGHLAGSLDECDGLQPITAFLRVALTEVAQRHLAAVVVQLLVAEGVHNVTSWGPAITRLACEAAAAISPPAVAAYGVNDPRFYIKVKRVANVGTPEDSAVVHGLVCRKNVAHRRMQTHVDQPRIMMLGSTLEYQRTAHKLSSFDTLLDQEREHLRLAVERVAALKPQVLLVEKSVARYAQDALLHKGISLVLNVKPALLERIARCTGAQLAPSIEHLNADCIASCREFYVETIQQGGTGAGSSTSSSPRDSYASLQRMPSLADSTQSGHADGKRGAAAPGPKTLMYFKGCPHPLGCTILLKGGSQEELTQVKRVMQFAAYAAYHSRLETAFLADELASAKAAMHTQLRASEDDGGLIALSKERLRQQARHIAQASAECSLLDSGEEPTLLSVSPHVTVHDWKHRPRISVPEPPADPASNRGAMHASASTMSISTLAASAAPVLKATAAAGLLYSRQRLYVSIACRNPIRGLLCEPPAVQRIEYYRGSDVPLATFLAASAPQPHKQCPQAACGDGATSHLRTFLHGTSRITLSVTRLTPEEALPGAKDGQVWFWARPFQEDQGPAPTARRIALSPEASCLSIGHFLELSFGAHHLAVEGRAVHAGFVRYFGLGSTVACFHHERVHPNSVHLPDAQIAHSVAAQQQWLQQEVEELSQEAYAAFSAIEHASAPDHGGTRPQHAHWSATSPALSRGAAAPTWDDIRSPRGEGTGPTGVKAIPSGHHTTGKSSPRSVNSARLSPIVSPTMHSMLSSSVSDDEVDEEARDSASSVEEDEETRCHRNWGVAIRSPFAHAAKQKEEAEVEPDAAPRPVHREASASSAFMSHFEDWAEFVDSPSESPTHRHPEPKCETPSPPEPQPPKPVAAVPTHRAKSVQELLSQATAPAALSLPHSPAQAAEQLSKLKFPGLGDRRWLNTAPGFIPLSVGRVEVHGRALLPAGPDLVVIVRDDEPTSLIAYALATREHQSYLDDAHATILYGAGRPTADGWGATTSSSWAARSHADLAAATTRSNSPKAVDLGDAAASGPNASRAGRPETAPTSNHSPSRDPQVASSASAPPALLPIRPPANPGGMAGGVAAESRAEARAEARADSDGPNEWKVLMSAERFDFRHSVDDESPGMPWARAKLQVVAYYAPQFGELRRRCCAGGERAFLASLSRCRKWTSRGGKSGSYFAKTRDDRYVVKQLSKSEKQSFLEFAPSYFRYLGPGMAKGQQTCLAKILGVYQVSVKAASGASNGSGLAGVKDGVMDLLIMENIFYARDISRIYDLKGSERSRYAADDPADATAVLMDENLRESNLSAPILVNQQAYARLERALWNDTSFLSSLGVMDYSMLVGVDKHEHVLVVGIIDFVRQYTWDKQLETWVKSAAILGSAGKEPTVISPKQYCRRFRIAMASYFTCVPSGSEDPAPPLNPDAP
ncbi:hypothetical protein WJX72_000689 [[Myrmecia] bisecta]|uniref:1-phosphatidylinositol-3-phosphate 5-kinase n=1 Tax=[Myrmecia] bisecta TaxID=41462 RepID=A0AAW1QE10_9CHLO